ncbi:TetR/AcrR family transcriptional regulator [Leifsonia flava]|uniref:TetR/AcrR family transcriptional regulator n=1 Tax=Orlajensenia leifsoniae TaxID=2561933 RepID=A0A4Y9R7U9_9MICO|nr:TetR/AcrR family transcriptional regulator [Leifsonia flava]TFV99763.1 TetR/AcrR family transcriptional regulator [Leifsonia flava]
MALDRTDGGLMGVVFIAAAGAANARAASAARTRAAILESAATLFVERGFGAVSLRDIAAQAGLSHPGVLKHFSSKDEILDVIVGDLEQANEDRIGERVMGVDVFVEIARQNALRPGYIPLFATLAGEATSAAHPAHVRFRDRHRRLRGLSGQFFAQAIADGELSAETDAVGEAIRLAAAWDGLQLISLYLPDRIDVPAMLETHLRQLQGMATAAAGNSGVDSSNAEPTLDFAPWTNDVGYAPGRKRREQIIVEASAVFASRGFYAASLREIAEQVGIGKSTLLHHFSSKEELLAAVIERRDSTIGERTVFDPQTDPRGTMLSLPDGARHDAASEPGLIELYAVLSAEAAAPSHPAHAYFEQRFAMAIDRFAGIISRLDLGPDVDPWFEASWLVALWDGLQLQWLYDPDGVDVGDQLEAHVAALLAR